MDKEKITDCIAGLRVLIDDWTKVETREIEEQAERLIIAKAAELVKIAEPKKSEMACNCCAEEIDAQQKCWQWLRQLTHLQRRLTNWLASKNFDKTSTLGRSRRPKQWRLWKLFE